MQNKKSSNYTEFWIGVISIMLAIILPIFEDIFLVLGFIELAVASIKCYIYNTIRGNGD